MASKTYSVTNVTSVPWDTEREYCVLIKDVRGNRGIFADTQTFFFNNAGTARWLDCAVTTIKPMAAVELQSIWLESLPKPARMGRASGYLMRVFAKAPQVTFTGATMELCSRIAWQSMQTRSVSQGTEVTLVTEYVPYRYYTSHCVLIKDARGTSIIPPCLCRCLKSSGLLLPWGIAGLKKSMLA